MATIARVAAAVMQTAEIAVRQASSTTGASTDASTGASATTLTPSSVPSPSLDHTSSGSSDATDSPGGDGTDDGGSNSSLLFFVALGFGVVFTNLWIIVGVKYCFRYNARVRALRASSDGEINMENMQHRPRRRREKKLMTMDEVNERFPMQKYKNWVASRAQQGLPTAGGITAPPSRSNSVRTVSKDSEKHEEKTERPRTSTESSEQSNPSQPRPSTEPSSPDTTQPSTDTTQPSPDTTQPSTDATKPSAEPSSTDTSPSSPEPAPVSSTEQNPSEPPHEHDDSDDEQIAAALPQEWYNANGDTCAICIDTLENDDDVRGLTCGHAFHALCVDPWLTSRRACCPLCKADYYVPKPRPPDQQQQAPTRRHSMRQRNDASLQSSTTLGRFREIFRRMEMQSSGSEPEPEPEPQRQPQSRQQRFLNRLRFWRRSGQERTPPLQLEDGVLTEGGSR